MIDWSPGSTQGSGTTGLFIGVRLFQSLVLSFLLLSLFLSFWPSSLPAPLFISFSLSFLSLLVTIKHTKTLRGAARIQMRLVLWVSSWENKKINYRVGFVRKETLSMKRAPRLKPKLFIEACCLPQRRLRGKVGETSGRTRDSTHNISLALLSKLSTH